MTLSLDETREMLEGEYYRDNLFFLFERLFPNFVKCTASPPISSKKFKSCTLIGTSEKPDLKVYEVILPKEIEKQRVGITKEMFRIMNASGDFSAIVLFVNEDHQNYRLSLLTNYFVNDDGVYRKEKSNYHRYSYYLGVGTKTKTVYDFLYSKGSVKSLDELRDRFSVDIVNNQFYSEIAKAFTKLIGGSFGGQKYDRLLRFSQDVSPNKYSEFGVRLLGRLIFCWFLKEKRSESGIPLVPDVLFTDETINKSGNYYAVILQNLFFESLNTPWEKRNTSLKNEYFSSIPYLNGGLFSPHHDDFYDDIDSRNVYIPNNWFKDLYSVLRQYNFTVDESTSYDVELSIDPEMLGRIFENLLAEINPETGESARKNTGSFYTPRDIVDFMVNTSLYEHLINTTNVEPSKIDTLVQFGDNEDVTFDDNERTQIVDSLYNIKILDPACGSGAFPMGLLQKIVYILQEIDPDNVLWLDKIDNDMSIDNETKKEIEWSSIDYIRKLLVIKNSIYGVDIQPIAAEISRLRCFLSIIIEEKIDDDKPNRGVRPLPNLDFKFAIGNTLIPLENNNETTMNIFDDYEQLEELNEIRDKWFTADSSTKEVLKERLMSLQKEMSDAILLGQNFESDKFKRLSKWNPSSSDENYWFDSAWMFGVDKFDIVIGNPPYIQLQNRSNKDDENDKTKFGDIYQKYDYETFARTGDMYCLFYEKGINLLKERGILVYITSNKWMRAGYAGEPDKKTKGSKQIGLRKFLSRKNPLILIDFSGERIFESATVDTNILVIQNANNEGNTVACTATKECRNNLSDFVKQNGKRCSFNTSEIWVYADNIAIQIKKKIEEKGVPLEEWGIAINYGIKTGYNEAFILDEETKEQLIKDDPKSAEIIRPILRGRDIKRYGFNFENIWLLNTHNGVPENNIPRIDVANYPAVKKYLDGFITELSQRQDRGETPYNLRSCSYMEEFFHPKIMCNFIADRVSFCYVPNEMFCVDPAFFVQNEKYNKYFLACLNTCLIDWYYRLICEKINGQNVLMLGKTLRKIPIPKIDDDKLKKINFYVDLIVDNDDNGPQYEKELEHEISKLYGLSDEEEQYIKDLYSLRL